MAIALYLRTMKATAEIEVPKELHRFILGKGGKNLQSIMDRTGAVVRIPNAESSSDLVTVRGDAQAIELVRQEFEAIKKEKVCFS